MDVINVFVGCAANNEDIESQAVLEWSIRKHSSRSVNITWMQQSRDKASPFFVGPGGWCTDIWATPFSGFRWAVPFLADGPAIYTDSDVIFMADPAELVGQLNPDDVILGRDNYKSKICVSLWNCEKGRAVIGDIKTQRQEARFHLGMMDKIQQHVRPFANEWNCLDREMNGRPVTSPEIKVIHYTDMRAQPQLRYAVPRLSKEGRSHWFDGYLELNKYPAIDALFDQLLTEAKANGYDPSRYVVEPFGDCKKRSFK
jgi:hypothetical protein